METPVKQALPLESAGFKKSCLWVALAVGCFQAAYTSVNHPVLGLLIFGYAYFLVRLTDQPSVKRAFYFGLVTGYLCYAPQAFFMWRIFSVASVILWLVLAFWTGLFTAIVCGCIRRWGKARAMWLVPVVWVLVTSLKLLGVPLNLFNVLAFPLVLGVGVDYGIYVVIAMRQEGDLQRNLATVVKPVLLAGLCTTAGFGSLGLAANPALRGLGVVCALGVAWCLFATLFFVLPAYAWRGAK